MDNTSVMGFEPTTAHIIFLLYKNHALISADEILPVGSIHVNSLSELYLSPALKDLLDFSLTRQNNGPRPVLNTKSKVFELDTCRTIGKVRNLRKY